MDLIRTALLLGSVGAGSSVIIAAGIFLLLDTVRDVKHSGLQAVSEWSTASKKRSLQKAVRIAPVGALGGVTFAVIAHVL